MKNELIPPSELDHPLPGNLSHDQLASLWLDVLAAGDEMLMAGIKARLPPGGDARSAYREWYEQYAREHFEMLERMAQRFNRVLERHGSAGSS
jgi:hypothetical protein